MSISLRGVALTALSSALLSSTAHAGIFDMEPAKGGFYVSGFVGGAFPFDAEFEGTQSPGAGVPGAPGAPANVEVDFGTDAFFGGAVGAQLPFKYWKIFHPRLEVEVSRLETDVDDGSFNNGDQSFSGDQGITFYLINNKSDIQWAEDQRIIPYFGGGLGLASVNTDVQYFPNNGVATTATFALEGDETVFATVSNIGVTFKTNSNIDVYTEARYYKLYDVDTQRVFVGGGANQFNANLDDNTDGITVTAGMRINF